MPFRFKPTVFVDSIGPYAPSHANESMRPPMQTHPCDLTCGPIMANSGMALEASMRRADTHCDVESGVEVGAMWVESVPFPTSSAPRGGGLRLVGLCGTQDQLPVIRIRMRIRISCL